MLLGRIFSFWKIAAYAAGLALGVMIEPIDQCREKQSCLDDTNSRCRRVGASRSLHHALVAVVEPQRIVEQGFDASSNVSPRYARGERVEIGQIAQVAKRKDFQKALRRHPSDRRTGHGRAGVDLHFKAGLAH